MYAQSLVMGRASVFQVGISFAVSVGVFSSRFGICCRLLGAMHLHCAYTATCLAGWLAGCPSQPVLYQND